MILVDSDICVDFLRGVDGAAEFLHDLRTSGHELAISSVSAAELSRGVFGPAGTHRRVVALQDLLDGFVEIPFGPKASQRFGETMGALDRAGRPVPVADGMVAATALEAGARLATRDRRHFEGVAGLEIVAPHG